MQEPYQLPERKNAFLVNNTMAQCKVRRPLFTSRGLEAMFCCVSAGSEASAFFYPGTLCHPRGHLFPEPAVLGGLGYPI